MTTHPTQGPNKSLDAAWRRYATALVHSMEDVRAETPEDVHLSLIHILPLGLGRLVQIDGVGWSR